MRSPLVPLAIVCLVFGLAGHGTAQVFTGSVTTDPAQSQFVYDDVVNFIRVAKMLEKESDTVGILQTEYLDRGTPGLAEFIRKYGLTAERLHKAMRKYPEEYSSLDNHPAAIKEMAVPGRAAYTKMKEVIPNALFPPTYFVVEGYRGINSGSGAGMLISCEKWVLSELDKITTLVHELTHMQQVFAIGYEEYVTLFNDKKSLLGLCIREGTAELVAELVTGRVCKEEAMAFLKVNEARLWPKFAAEMHGRETGEWMWSTPTDSLQPRDVGYVLGCEIVRAYYDQADDKMQAVRDILGVTDYAAFFEKSGYAEQFQ